MPGASPLDVKTPILLTFLLPMFYNLCDKLIRLQNVNNVYTVHGVSKYEFEVTLPCSVDNGFFVAVPLRSQRVTALL